MEKLLLLKQDAVGRRAFVKREAKKQDIQYSHLPNDELMELLKQIKVGNTNAMETLSAQYIRLIIDICGDFKGNGLTDLELILKGNTGLINAAENFDVSRGIDFSAYATWAIRQQIIRAIDEKELNKPMPLHQIGLLFKTKFWHQNNLGRRDNMQL